MRHSLRHWIRLLVYLFMSLTFGFSSYGARIKRESVPNQFIIKFKSSPNDPQTMRLLTQSGLRVVRTFQSNGAHLVELPKEQSLGSQWDKSSLIARLKQSNEVDYIEPNWIVRAHALPPNDPYFDELYALGSHRQGGGEIFAQQAWNYTTGSNRVLVAVIDSGVDYTHQDLAANYWNNPGESGLDTHGRDRRTNGVDDDGNGKVDDWRGWNFLSHNNDPMDDNQHGTHCAGIIGAVGNNQRGIVGVNWNVSLVGLKFLNKDGVGTIADAVSAVEYAIAIGAQIINNSWGGDEYSETMLAVIRKAEAAGILFVVAAGNYGNNNDIVPDYPASFEVDNVISVGAVDRDGQIAGFSNFGPRSVHIAAPGVEILSTIPNNQYAKLDGTSMAAPYVSGAAALLKSLYPQLRARELKARLLGAAERSAENSRWVATGVLNVFKAMNNDFTPPQAPKGILLQKASASFVELEWEMGPDEINERINYEVRYAAQPILNENDWEKSPRAEVTFLPSKLSRHRHVKIYGLPLMVRGYLALKAVDASGNTSGLSAPIPFALSEIRTYYVNKGDTMENLTTRGPWGIEEVNGHGPVLSDSPGGTYGYNKTTLLMLPSLQWTGNEMLLSFNSRFDIENGFDFAFVEVSFDQGEKWQSLALFTGMKDWSSYLLSITPPLESDGQRPPSGSEVWIRFRLTTDQTGAKDGWYLANIMVSGS